MLSQPLGLEQSSNRGAAANVASASWTQCPQMFLHHGSCPNTGRL